MRWRRRRARWLHSRSTQRGSLFTRPTSSVSTRGRSASSAPASIAASNAIVGRSAPTPTSCEPLNAPISSVAISPGGGGSPSRAARSSSSRFSRAACESSASASGSRSTPIARADSEPPTAIASVEHDENGAFFDAVPFGDPQLCDATRARRLDGDLHLHRFEDQEHLFGLDLRAHAGLDLPDVARDLGGDLGRHLHAPPSESGPA